MHPQLSIELLASDFRACVVINETEWSVCQRDEEVGRLEHERNKPGSQLGQSCLAGGYNMIQL